MNIKFKLQTKINNLFPPTWVYYPSHIQLDISNYCNLWMGNGVGCSYCNVKQGGAFSLPRGQMNDEMFLYILNNIKQAIPRVIGVHPFGNGEPLLDKKLKWRATKIKEICNAECYIDTNGTLFKNRENLIHPNLVKVRFTISATTPETYKLVHGKPLFKEALKTFNYFIENKCTDQEPVLHFIVTKENYHELNDWIMRFKGFRRRIFPVHTHPTIQFNSEKTKLKGLTENIFFDSTGNQYYDITPENLRLPCQCWDLLAISPFGEIMHCIDFPYTFNYGSIYEKPLLQAWKERLSTRMNHPTCNQCSLRRKNYKQIIERWLK